MTTHSLYDKLQIAVDRQEILELAACYNRAADGTDPDALLAVFTPEAVVEMRGLADGPCVFRGAELAGLVAPYEGQRVHMTMDAIVAVEGDRGKHRSTLLLCTRSRKKGIAAFFTGSYEDELVRTKSGWRFVRRLATIDYANEGQMPLATTLEAR